MKRRLLFLVLFSLIRPIIAQDIPIGQWKDHLSYKSAIAVTEGNGKVYCASKSGIFSYNRGDNSMDR